MSVCRTEALLGIAECGARVGSYLDYDDFDPAKRVVGVRETFARVSEFCRAAVLHHGFHRADRGQAAVTPAPMPDGFLSWGPAACDYNPSSTSIPRSLTVVDRMDGR